MCGYAKIRSKNVNSEARNGKVIQVFISKAEVWLNLLKANDVLKESVKTNIQRNKKED